MKIKWLVASVLAVLFIPVMANMALGQVETPPAPYAGMENPYPWDDDAAREAGKKIYQAQCLGCHGAAGGAISAFDFSKPAFSQDLETSPDFFFWVFSEGRMTLGMPGYKSSLSAEQIWQTLTYVSALGSAPPPAPPAPAAPGAPPAVSPGPVPPPPASGVTISLLSLDSADAGQEIALGVHIKDAQDKPVSGALVRFFIEEDFFASGLMEIGEALTDDQGIASVTHLLTRTGERTIVAKYDGIETRKSIIVEDTGAVFYRSKAGLEINPIGPDIFIGPKSSHQLDEMGNAPTAALRLPGGIFSSLWLIIGALALVWVIYFTVMYNVLRIPVSGTSRVTGSRLVPVAGLVIIICLGLLMLYMVITGPYSHFHLT